VRSALFRRWVRLTHRGHGVECPCCGREYASFAADWNRPDAICPGCGAQERHRALWLHLRGVLAAADRPFDLLHFAPEHAVQRRIEQLPELRYLTADLDGDGVDVAADITGMPFDDASFDGIVCSHVLEHVDDDRAAMGELCRVLRPRGWAAVLVPLDLDRAETYEDPAVLTPAQRERAYWQHDHVRLYAPDIADRLAEAGLEVEAVRVAETLPMGAVRRHGLLSEEVVFRCTRPALVAT
jgi:SAM-dependent methyltransferase